MGTTLIDGMPVRSPKIGNARTSRIASAPVPNRIGWRQSRSAQRGEGG